MKNFGLIISLVTSMAVTAVLLQMQCYSHNENCAIGEAIDKQQVMLTSAYGSLSQNKRDLARLESAMNAKTNQPVALK